jgi:hypothetical protein
MNDEKKKINNTKFIKRASLKSVVGNEAPKQSR